MDGCPLHSDHKPSFWLDGNQGLFYRYGCGRGGDIIRFVEFYHQVKFPQALAGLLQWCCSLPVLRAAADFLSHAMATPRRGPWSIFTNTESVRQK